MKTKAIADRKGKLSASTLKPENSAHSPRTLCIFCQEKRSATARKNKQIRVSKVESWPMWKRQDMAKTRSKTDGKLKNLGGNGKYHVSVPDTP